MGKFDKLIKENLAEMFQPLAKRIGFDFEDAQIEIIKDKLQYTIEREPDFLFKVCHDESAKNYIAHFDFQTDNDMEMPDRMLFYRHLIKLIYKLPVRQIVFYIGNDDLTMPDCLIEPDLYFRYKIVDIRTFKSAELLASDIPQEIILAILGDFEGETPEVMMEKIILRIISVVKSKKEFQKFTFHLHILTALRKLSKIFNQKMKNMPLTFDLDLENDPIFLEGRELGIKKGMEKGMEKGEIILIEKMLISGELSVERIAKFAEKPVDFIFNIQKRLIEEGRLFLKAKRQKKG